MTVLYQEGDATDCHHQFTCIAHIVNDVGGWGAGFVVPLGERYPAARDRYLKCFDTLSNLQNQRSRLRLGEVQLIKIPHSDPPFLIANMVAQSGLRRIGDNPPVRYVALAHCLRWLDARLPFNYQIQMPRIGAGLGGGDWSTIESIINATVVRDVLVLDLPPRKTPAEFLADSEALAARLLAAGIDPQTRKPLP